MKREDKSLLKRQQIINSAIAEFGLNTYAEASLNSICKRGDFSKGIIYHYFKDKDELYLVCVSKSFEQLIDFLNQQTFKFTNFEEAIEKLLVLRHQFLTDNPDFGNIFINALLQPPKHLLEDIKKIKAQLKEFNISYFDQVLKNLKLKSDVSRDEALEYFLVFQDSFTYYFQSKNHGDIKELFHDHELKLSKFLKIMFYGMAKEETK